MHEVIKKSMFKYCPHSTFIRIVLESTAKASPLMSWKMLRNVPRLSRPGAEEEGRLEEEERPEEQHTDLSALLQTRSGDEECNNVTEESGNATSEKSDNVKPPFDVRTGL